ncbi:universal stress protein [Halarsenatibacter silvermanii]|uniref:Nucleotide-binding universal stress protein, UspA family n=1 Tax=Halarsenatibacter silvermanii TaxID=321763 RepID=A0A1G9KWS9_9FIRM|nr:universal stress protein [Halarsenatibacter silvermanii]SDL54188.1 Nucleotide-binding universal stress protein, UspA family [Halarsenatibacter silvermanii]
MSTAKIYESLVNKLVQNAPCPVGVLKDNGLQEPRKILVPYRGSEHAYWGVKVAKRLASNYGNMGEVVILRVIERGGDPQKEEENAWKQVKDIFEDSSVSGEIKVVFADKVVEGIINESYNKDYNLIIMGASKEWRLKNMLFGSVPDIVAEEAETSVLMVRCYDQKIDEEIQLEGEVVEEDDLEEDLQQSPEKF